MNADVLIAAGKFSADLPGLAAEDVARALTEAQVVEGVGALLPHIDEVVWQLQGWRDALVHRWRENDWDVSEEHLLRARELLNLNPQEERNALPD